MKGWIQIACIGLLLGFTFAMGEDVEKKLSDRYDRAIRKQNIRNRFKKKDS